MAVGLVLLWSRAQREGRSWGFRAGDGARRIEAVGVPVFYYVFDLLRWDGQDATRVPLRQRKTLLHDALDWRDPLRWCEHLEAAGESMHAQVRRRRGGDHRQAGVQPLHVRAVRGLAEDEMRPRAGGGGRRVHRTD